MKFVWNRGPSRRGMTLVELLVVIGILVVVTAIALPIIKPALKDRKVREASRQLNSFITLARASALESGRSAGIYLERSQNNANACFDVYLAEEPFPYSGDTVDLSFATVGSATIAVVDPILSSHFQLAFNGDPFAQVAVGDEIKFDFKGPRYVIRLIHDADTTNPLNPIQIQFGHPEARWGAGPDMTLGTLDDVLVTTPMTPPFGTTRYQVFRQPTKSSVKALTLPTNISIDLRFSGVGLPNPASGLPVLDGREFGFTTAGDRTPVVIMFSPNGNIKKINVANTSNAPRATTYLLVGRTEQIDDTDGLPAVPYSSANTTTTIPLTRNIVDNSNMWITIGHRSGQVTTSPNGWAIPPSSLGATNYFVDLMADAREFAISGEAVGGQ